MPIFEYHCNQCDNEFEKLVFSGEKEDFTCPVCQSGDINKKVSASSVLSKGSSGSCAAPASSGFR